ncbi:MAG TPA: class II aldolase/adducin family protein [Stellaceae bacterium]|nr:class II aldolase/adducin family protein [Stellaceae bacterium]
MRHTAGLLQDRTPEAVRLETEWEVRTQLAACYRLIAHFGMDDTIFGHITARIPGRPTHFLINPYGLLFGEMTASALVVVDHEGQALEASAESVNAAGFVIHSAIHTARPDVDCVLHTHTRAGVAISCLREGLLPINQFALEFAGRIACHDYEGIALDLAERERLIRDLGDRNVMILRNHGLLTAADTIPGAFYLTYYLEQAARVQMDVMASGGTIVTPTPEIQARTARQYTSFGNPKLTGMRGWPAMLRLLDRVNPGYAE